MAQSNETESADTNTSRRQVLTAVGSALTTSLGGVLGEINHQDILPSIDNTPHKMTRRRSRSTTVSLSRRSQRPAYVVPPSGSMSSLLANLPYIMNDSADQMPVLLVDKLDYSRVLTMEKQGDSSAEIQSLTLAYDQLHRRGVVRFIDYSDFYSHYTQQNILRQNRAMIRELSSDTQQRIAARAADAWIDYGRGTYATSEQLNMWLNDPDYGFDSCHNGHWMPI